jgi:hypothetical protein
MAYRPLNEQGEIWKTLTKKINDAFEFIEGKINTIFSGGKKSITQDVDGKIQLVNDLDDSELIPESVYGVSSSGIRGWLKIKNYKNFVVDDWAYINGEYILEFQHNLGSENIIVQVYENNKKVEVDIEIINENKIKLTSLEAFEGKVIVEG